MRTAAYVLAITLSYAAGLVTPHVKATGSPLPPAVHITNGAYRDGLYLGRLDAASGAVAHASVGRWSSPADRSSFLTGYEDGYHSKP